MSRLSRKDEKEAVPRTLDEEFEAHKACVAALKETVRTIEGWDVVYAKEDLDLICLRFAQGFYDDVKQASECITNATKWRIAWKSDQVDETKTHPVEEKARKLFPSLFLHKKTKNDKLIFWAFIGFLRPKEYMEMVSLEEHKSLLAFNMVKQHRILNRVSRERNRLEMLTVFYDIKGVSMEHLKYREYLSIETSWAQLVLVEHMRNMYILYTPSIFATFWSFIKPMLAENVQKKIAIVNSADSETVLKSLFLDEDLPDFRGGTCRCGLGKSQCCPLLLEDSLEAVTIPPKREFKKEYAFEAGAKIEWLVDKNAIAAKFSITVSGESSLESTDGRGTFVASGPGTVVVSMTNKSSMWGINPFFTVQISY